LESLGYETVWQGGSPPADLAHVSAILDATSTLKVATGIVNVWTADAAEIARSNLQRLGFTADDVAGEGSDRLIDALVVSGDDAEIRRRFEEHLNADADHVAVQLIAEPDAGFRRLADALGVS
jgi:hypothetical protein